MTKNVSVNNDKKTRAIKVTSRDEFVKVINDVKELVNAPDFVDNICEKTGNGLYKFSTTMPNDMTGVKTFDAQGLKWYQIPTNDYRLSLTSYISYKMTCETKARSNAIKQLSELPIEQLIALLNSQK